MASAHGNGGGCGKETEEAGEAAMLEGEVHGSGEVKDCQQQSGEEIGQAATEALEPRTAAVGHAILPSLFTSHTDSSSSGETVSGRFAWMNASA